MRAVPPDAFRVPAPRGVVIERTPPALAMTRRRPPRRDDAADARVWMVAERDPRTLRVVGLDAVPCGGGGWGGERPHVLAFEAAEHARVRLAELEDEPEAPAAWLTLVCSASPAALARDAAVGLSMPVLIVRASGAQCSLPRPRRPHATARWRVWVGPAPSVVLATEERRRRADGRWWSAATLLRERSANYPGGARWLPPGA